MKVRSTWYSQRLQRDITVVRWGEVGTPVVLFPTAGGDAEECERFLMIQVLAPLLESGRIKIYSCDSAAGQVWFDNSHSGGHKAWYQNRFDEFVVHELVPAIHTDCRSRWGQLEILTAGASIGAFNALATLCRHPDLFTTAICMSGTYDLGRWMHGEHTADYHFCSPLHFVPYLGEGEQLSRLRQRFVILATGEGRWEAPGESWRVAHVLGQKGIPNRVDLWGAERDHDWTTWRDMLPHYLDHHTRPAE
ncbi:MAG: alpha/beta hydrolase-fold protein [Myxococcota bacterium]